MTNATAPQAAHFGAMAAEWWDPTGSSAMLHRLNPVRLAYIRAQVDKHWGGDMRTRTPLAGKRVLDMGCGAGLLTEPLARMGGSVTGIDAALENVAVARAHAEQSGLTIDYRQGEVDAATGETFDLITCLEVVEHVSDPGSFVHELATLLAPGALLILSTPNRTLLSRVAVVGIGETFGGIPRGTHDWSRFVTPEELCSYVEGAELAVIDRRGVMPNLARGFTLSDNLALDYFLTASNSASH